MSETKVSATFTVVDPLTIGGEPLKPDDYVIYEGKAFLPSRTAVWELPPIENVEGAPTANMSYGFGYGGIAHTDIQDWGWTINGETHDPRPANLVPIEGGGRHDIVITVVLKETVEVGRKFNLTATIGRA